MDSPVKKSSKKVVRIAEDASAEKGYDFYILNRYIGNFKSIEDGRQGVIAFCNLTDGEELFAWSRDVSYVKV
jgi:hypothetical protein